MDFKSNKDELSLLCTKSKYGNFKEGKIYNAIAYATMGKSSQYTNFRIEDEDGDLYTIEDKHLKESGPLQFKIVEKTRTLDNNVLKEENNKEDMEL